jgi:hypothetical protein
MLMVMKASQTKTWRVKMRETRDMVHALVVALLP